MKKVKIGYCIVFITIIFVLCLFVFYFPISIENINVFSNKSLQSIYINNYAYKNKYNVSEINDKETIDEFIEFLNQIKIQRIDYILKIVSYLFLISLIFSSIITFIYFIISGKIGYFILTIFIIVAIPIALKTNDDFK